MHQQAKNSKGPFAIFIKLNFKQTPTYTVPDLCILDSDCFFWKLSFCEKQQCVLFCLFCSKNVHFWALFCRGKSVNKVYISILNCHPENNFIIEAFWFALEPFCYRIFIKFPKKFWWWGCGSAESIHFLLFVNSFWNFFLFLHTFQDDVFAINYISIAFPIKQFSFKFIFRVIV